MINHQRTLTSRSRIVRYRHTHVLNTLVLVQIKERFRSIDSFYIWRRVRVIVCFDFKIIIRFIIRWWSNFQNLYSSESEYWDQQKNKCLFTVLLFILWFVHHECLYVSSLRSCCLADGDYYYYCLNREYPYTHLPTIENPIHLLFIQKTQKLFSIQYSIQFEV